MPSLTAEAAIRKRFQKADVAWRSPADGFTLWRSRNSRWGNRQFPTNIETFACRATKPDRCKKATDTSVSIRCRPRYSPVRLLSICFDGRTLEAVITLRLDVRSAVVASLAQRRMFLGRFTDSATHQRVANSPCPR